MVDNGVDSVDSCFTRVSRVPNVTYLEGRLGRAHCAGTRVINDVFDQAVAANVS